MLPGQGQPRKYALIGDLSVLGNLPPLLEVVSDHFWLTANQPVAPTVEIVNRWANTPVGETYLDPEVQGAQGASTYMIRGGPIIEFLTHSALVQTS